MTLDGWVDTFLRETNPEAELRAVEAIAMVYGGLVQCIDLSAEDKTKLYGVLCYLCAVGDSSPEVETKIPRGAPSGDLLLLVLYRRALSTRHTPPF